MLALTLALSLAASPLAPLEPRKAALHQLLQDHWERHLRDFPELASIYGDPRYHDRLTDLSPAAVDARAAAAEGFLARLKDLDPSGLDPQDVLSHRLLAAQLEDELEGFRLHLDELPLTQMNGPHLDFGVLVGLLPFESAQDYQDYLARLRAFPAQLEQAAAWLRKGVADKRVLPTYLIEKVLAQVEGMARQAPEKTVYAGPLGRFPKAVAEADRARLREATLAAIRDGVLPAYARLATYLRQEYLPHGLAGPGAWALPEGEATYAHLIRHYTSTAQTPEALHQLGLAEVERIEDEMHRLARAAGQPDLAHYRAALHQHPPQVSKREVVLARFAEHIASMKAHLPQLFGRLPKAGLEVRPVEAFREKDAPAAEYEEGTPDGARPGHVMVNPGQWYGEDALGLEATAYHEGVPGHHLQLSLAQEQAGLPPFRQHGDYGAFVEGWALYAEGLAKEVGAYPTKESDFGRLDSELFRAVRLVVDTGLHAKRWSRQQALDYMLAHSSSTRGSAEVEIDRYVAWPGQALGYKVGQLRIRALRARAEKALGPRFDLRAFHDTVLGAGPLPLDALESRIDAWIAAQKAK